MGRVGRLVRRARTTVRRHGWRNALCAGLLKALRHQRWLKVLRAHYVEEAKGGFLQFPQGYSGGFVAPRALAGFARDEVPGISPEFVQYATAKGDKCYSVNYNGTLCAYGWYATTPTRVSADLRLRFGRDYVYMYKGFTHEQHRGKRLFPTGMSRALRLYRSAGYKGMLLYVDAYNLDSLKSCARMGFRSCGSIYVAKVLGRYFVFETPGCARFGLRIEATSSTGSGAAPPFYRFNLVP
jgi:hypothetical protein